jgi:hypothetical protein
MVRPVATSTVSDSRHARGSLAKLSGGLDPRSIHMHGRWLRSGRKLASFGAGGTGFVRRDERWCETHVLRRSPRPPPASFRALASFGARRIGFVRRGGLASFGALYPSPATGHRPPATGHRPPATAFSAIRIAKERSEHEVPISSSGSRPETFCDCQDNPQDFGSPPTVGPANSAGRDRVNLR